MEALQTKEYKGCVIEIHQDELDINPREEFDCHLGTMVCSHPRYNLGDEQSSPEEIFDRVAKGECMVRLPLYLYDHSGITISTRPFSCPWDSGQVGYIYVTYDRLAEEFDAWKNNPTPEMIEHVEKILIAEVKEYDHYLTGRVYGFVTKSPEDVDIDSCWGFFGDPEESGLLEDAKGSIDFYLKEQKKADWVMSSCWAY